MTQIKPEERVNEVLRRTIVNLEFVKKHRANGGPYEVTQLINSFMGAMAHPWESISRVPDLDLNETKLIEAKRKHWPILRHELPTDRIPRSYGQMLKWTRHSFAHGNIEFLSDGINIVKVRFWNQDPYSRPNPDQRTWGTVVFVSELEDILYFFHDLVQSRIPRSRAERLTEAAD